MAPERIYCGNGSNEVLQSLLLAYGGPGRRVAVFEPTYTLHRHISRITDTEVVAGRRKDDFELDLAEVARVLSAAEPVVTFLCSPNNPTGLEASSARRSSGGRLAPGLVVVDEAYGQFGASSALGLVTVGRRGRHRIVVVRTFSKTWSMAGLRLVTSWVRPPSSRRARLVILPYHLNVATQLAGRLALQFVDEMETRVAMINEERGRIAATLSDLPVETWPSDANFILFRPPQGRRSGRTSSTFSVLVRDCSEWPGLAGCLRLTVGLPEENDRFMAALTESLR